jgi:hypothetical protein
MPTLRSQPRHLIPTPVPDAELAADAATIRAILRKYSLDPRRYSAALPLHPASLAGIARSRCLTIADVLAAMYDRDSIYAAYEQREALEKGLAF